MAGFSFPYHEPRQGFWGEKTSTLNFCEEDYVMSYYCAEVCNTLTNILFLVLGVKGIRDCIKYSHPTIFLTTFVGYIVVGCGSTLFHASLKYPMQLVDELAMIYTTCFMCHATFAYGRSGRFSFALGGALVGLAWFITARYYETKDPKFHQDAYTVLTVTVVFSNLWIMERRVRPALKARDETRSPSSTVPKSSAILSQVYIMVATGLSVFLGGYLIWALDNVYCDTIRVWRHHIQLPWAVVLEGHAWWHLMTGIGAYFYIVWRVWIHRLLAGDEDKYRLYWPSLLSLPQLLREVETQALAAQQQISLVRTQQTSKQREMRMAQLTRTELSSLPPDTNVYEGVGKMFVSLGVSDMQGKLDAQIKTAEGEVDGLGKRLHYLEVSQKNSREQIDRMLRGGASA
ncbi:ceramidase-domain-containing protein [Xylariaceae sp. FL0804]|nr:ceramidase-domain-containing protein [Xylariaceae sp. FL0804]